MALLKRPPQKDKKSRKKKQQKNLQCADGHCSWRGRKPNLISLSTSSSRPSVSPFFESDPLIYRIRDQKENRTLVIHYYQQHFRFTTYNYAFIWCTPPQPDQRSRRTKFKRLIQLNSQFIITIQSCISYKLTE